jgi:hypothetical protein
MVDDKYEKTNVAGSIDREFTVYEYSSTIPHPVCFSVNLDLLLDNARWIK